MRSIPCLKGFLLSAFIVAALSLSACNNNAKPPENDSLQNYNDSADVFDTSNIKYDTSSASDTSPVKKPGAGGEDTVRFTQHD
jgi:hypothetical protein